MPIIDVYVLVFSVRGLNIRSILEIVLVSNST